MLVHPSPIVSDGTLLNDALGGDEASWQRLDRHFRPLIAAAAMRHGRDFPPELVEDVVQEVYVAILCSVGRGGYRRGRPETASVLAHVRNAVARVRAGHRAPGSRSRTRLGVRPELRTARLDSAARSVAADDALPALEARLDLERLLRRADPMVQAAAEMVLEGHSLRAAAMRLGMTHTLLSRRLRALAIPPGGRRLRKH